MPFKIYSILFSSLLKPGINFHLWENCAGFGLLTSCFSVGLPPPYLLLHSISFSPHCVCVAVSTLPTSTTATSSWELGQGHPERLLGTEGKAQKIVGHHILLLVYLFVGWDPGYAVWIDSKWANGQTHFGQAVEMICNSCFSNFSQGQTLKGAMAGVLTGS